MTGSREGDRGLEDRAARLRPPGRRLDVGRDVVVARGVAELEAGEGNLIAVARRREQHDAPVLDAAAEDREHGARRVVEPVDVVGDGEHRRRAGAQQLEHGERDQQRLAGRLVAESERRRQRAPVYVAELADLGEHEQQRAGLGPRVAGAVGERLLEPRRDRQDRGLGDGARGLERGGELDERERIARRLAEPPAPQRLREVGGARVQQRLRRARVQRAEDVLGQADRSGSRAEAVPHGAEHDDRIRLDAAADERHDVAGRRVEPVHVSSAVTSSGRFAASADSSPSVASATRKTSPPALSAMPNAASSIERRGAGSWSTRPVQAREGQAGLRLRAGGRQHAQPGFARPVARRVEQNRLPDPRLSAGHHGAAAIRRRVDQRVDDRQLDVPAQQGRATPGGIGTSERLRSRGRPLMRGPVDGDAGSADTDADATRAAARRLTHNDCAASARDRSRPTQARGDDPA